MNEEFPLCLQEEKMDESKTQERCIDKLLEKIAQQEARTNALEKENRRLRSDVEKIILARLEAIEKVILPKVKEENERIEESLLKRIEHIENVALPEVKETNERITKRVEEFLVQRIESIEKEMIPKIQKTTFSDFEENMKHIEMHRDEKAKLLESVKSHEVPNPNFEFDPSCTYGSSFFFSNENKTATIHFEGVWRPCISTLPLPKSQVTKFSIKVEHTLYSDIMIGICPSKMRNESNIHKKQGVYCYSGFDYGRIYSDDKSSFLSNLGLKTGSIVTVTVDLSSNIINYDIDGTSVNTTNLNSSGTNSY